MARRVKQDSIVDAQVKKILEQQKEKIKKIQMRDADKIRKLNQLLNKQRDTRRFNAGKELEDLFKKNGETLNLNDVILLCKSIWPDVVGSSSIPKTSEY